MAQYTQKPKNSFVRGLLTEVGELTFPEDASVDELNMDLLRTGARRRRLGAALEAGAQTSLEPYANGVTSIHTWRNVNQEAGVNYTVVQNGAELYFYNQGDNSEALSNSRVLQATTGLPAVIDLNDLVFQAPNTVGTAPIDATSIKGVLVIANIETNSAYLSIDDNGDIVATEYTMRIRDFEWLEPPDDTYYERILHSTVVADDARYYATLNCGWEGGPEGVADAALATYQANGATDYWPPLTHPWYSGKDASDNFSVSEFNKVYAGQSLLSNGHFIVDLDRIERQVSTAAFTAYTATTRFTTLATYAGRVWYSGRSDLNTDSANSVYFSQTLTQGVQRLGDCFQVNDPTAEYLSDLLDTDGGVLTIPEAVNIKKLHVYGNYLYVFAENGVWQVGGIDDVFRATNYTVNKLTEEGINAATSFVSAKGQPFWWSFNGIHTLGQTEGGISAQNLTLNTIQTFWNEIGEDQRNEVKSAYDPLNNRFVWMYPEKAGGSKNMNRFLIFDATLNAWFPWSISTDDTAGAPIRILGATALEETVVGQINVNVADDSGALVVDSTGAQVIGGQEGENLISLNLKFLVRSPGGGLSFAEFTDDSFLDWGTEDYTSFAEAAYDFMGDMETRKASPYLTVFLKDTVTGWEANGGGGYDLKRDSSCLVSSYFDFSNTASVSQQQAFRRKFIPVADASDLDSITYPRSVVTSRLKIRGRGRSARLRFESETGKDFHLLGYTVIVAGNARF